MNLFFSVRGSCKHVAAILHHTTSVVAKGQNKSVTSKTQAWGKPGKLVHEPDFIENIKIQRVKGNAVIEEVAPKSSRFQYDPRPERFRMKKDITDYNFDTLASTSGPVSAILLYAPREARESFSLDDIDHVEEVTCTYDLDVPSMTSLVEKVKDSDPNISVENFKVQFKKVMFIDPSEAAFVERKTMGQADSKLWKYQRVGRITASKVWECSSKVNVESCSITRLYESTLKDVMGYRQPFTSPSTSWGRYHEKDAIKNSPTPPKNTTQTFKLMIVAFLFPPNVHTLQPLQMLLFLVVATHGVLLRLKIHGSTETLL